SLGTGLTLKDARKKASDHALRYQAGDRDLREAIDAEQREQQRQRDAELAAEQAEQARAAGTLGVLLGAYVADLERAGKTSARAVDRALRLHVEKAWPALWMMPAADVTPDDLLAVVARLADADKLREAAKLRAYLRAAYAAAVRARQNARAA